MTRYVVPTDKEPNQTFLINIEGKRVYITLLTRGQYIYASIKIEEEEKLNGIVCLNKTNILQYNTAGLKGKLYFEDTQGNSDPIYFGLNDRWVLYYEED